MSREKKPVRIVAYYLALLICVFSGCARVSDVHRLVGDVSAQSSVGSDAPSFLRADPHRSLVIEIAYVEGMAPSREAVESLVKFLEARLNKPEGITVVADDPIPPPSNGSFSVEAISDLEQQHRKLHTAGSQATAFFLFLKGSFDGDAEDGKVLGLAYGASSMAIFEESLLTMMASSGLPLGRRPLVESTVMAHEFGHLLGLTNLGTPLTAAHDDGAHDGHCNNENCLMYYAVNSSRGWSEALMEGSLMPPLDQNCINDLRAAGGK